MSFSFTSRSCKTSFSACSLWALNTTYTLPFKPRSQSSRSFENKISGNRHRQNTSMILTSLKCRWILLSSITNLSTNCVISHVSRSPSTNPSINERTAYKQTYTDKTQGKKKTSPFFKLVSQIFSVITTSKARAKQILVK